MRLFTGIDIHPDVLQKLGTLLDDLKTSAELNWSKVENLHITTKFIGEWPETRLDELQSALGRVEPRTHIQLEVKGLGFFPNAQRPRVFFAGVHAGGELPELATRIDDACEDLGCRREERDYSPHITLAKIRNARADGLRVRLATMQDTDMGTFTATEFHLYLSRPSSAGSIYSKLASFPLAS